MALRIELAPGQAWLGKRGRRISRRIVHVEGGADGVVLFSEGGARLRLVKRASFLRWLGRPYDERHGQRGTLV